MRVELSGQLKTGLGELKKDVLVLGESNEPKESSIQEPFDGAEVGGGNHRIVVEPESSPSTHNGHCIGSGEFDDAIVCNGLQEIAFLVRDLVSTAFEHSCGTLSKAHRITRSRQQFCQQIQIVHRILLCRGPRRSVGAGRRGLVLYLAIVTEAKAVLVLSRNKDERIVIGGDIVITVVEVRGDKVRLGIEAPKDVPIMRQELLDDDRTEAA